MRTTETAGGLVSGPDIGAVVAMALREDLGSGDVAGEILIPRTAQARATIVQREPGAIHGLAVVEEVFRQLDPAVRVQRLVDEGVWREADAVAALEGPERALLGGECTALNFLRHLSGVATAAARAARTVAGTGATVIDTRKTTPGLRTLEKAAVKAAGADNHRMGLFDVMLVKENHIAAAGGIAAAVHAARARFPDLELQVEVRNLDEVDQALAAGVPRLLLDNMTPAQLREAVERVAGRATLEASGGITFETLREVAETGVNWVSLGWLTHSAPALDVVLEWSSRGRD